MRTRFYEGNVVGLLLAGGMHLLAEKTGGNFWASMLFLISFNAVRALAELVKANQ